VAADGNDVHVVWQDDNFGNEEIFYKRSTDRGVSWSFQRLSSNSGESTWPAVSASGSDVQVVWQDKSLGSNWDIFDKRSTNRGSSWVFTRISNNAGYSVNPDVAVSGSLGNVVWEDSSLSSPRTDIFYKRGP